MIKNKLSQMEIMGLVIIVILFSVGLLFAIRYVVLKPSSEVKQTYEMVQLSSNTLNAFRKVNSPDCLGANMDTLLVDCALSWHQVDCDDDGNTVKEITDGDGNTFPNIPDSCHAVYDALTKIFASTFDVWKTKYYFRVYFDEDRAVEWEDGGTYISSGDCDPDTPGKPTEAPLPTDEGDLTLELMVCG